MWTKTVTRKEFLSIFQSERLESGLAYQADWLPGLYGTDDIQLVWRDNPTDRPSLPVAVVLEKAQFRDFLAWVLTYLPNLRPFTSYCRVVDSRSAEIFIKRQAAPSLEKLEGACLGVILGEAATYYVDSHLDPKTVSLNACASTYSFAMSRALSLGILNPDNDPVTNAWEALRTITKQPRLNLNVETLGILWSVIVSLSSDSSYNLNSALPQPPPDVMRACEDLYKTGDIQSQQWTALTRMFPVIRDIKAKMSATREERVNSFERSIGSMFSSRADDPVTAGFLCGYLASQIGPGTLDYVSLLIPHLQTFRTALAWYGFCAGLQEHSSLQNYSSGLGRRIIRDILRNETILDRPRCDIALAELEVLLGPENQTTDLRTAYHGYLEAELAPCVTTIVRWPSSRDPTADMYPSKQQVQEARSILNEFDEMRSRFGIISQRLNRVFGFAEHFRRPDRKPRK